MLTLTRAEQIQATARNAADKAIRDELGDHTANLPEMSWGLPEFDYEKPADLTAYLNLRRVVDLEHFGRMVANSANGEFDGLDSGSAFRFSHFQTTVHVNGLTVAITACLDKRNFAYVEAERIIRESISTTDQHRKARP